MTAIPTLRDLPKFCPRCAEINSEDQDDFILTGDPWECDCIEHIGNSRIGGELVF